MWSKFHSASRCCETPSMRTERHQWECVPPDKRRTVDLLSPHFCSLFRAWLSCDMRTKHSLPFLAHQFSNTDYSQISWSAATSRLPRLGQINLNMKSRPCRAVITSTLQKRSCKCLLMFPIWQRQPKRQINHMLWAGQAFNCEKRRLKAEQELKSKGFSDVSPAQLGCARFYLGEWRRQRSLPPPL